MKIDYEQTVEELEEDLDRIKDYSKTVDIVKLQDKLNQLKYQYTTHDGTDDDLPF